MSDEGGNATLLTLLEKAAKILGARALALFEAGHTVPKPAASPVAWTGLIYFAAAWQAEGGPYLETELEGFPPALQVRGCETICELIRGEEHIGILVPEKLPDLFACSALTETETEAVVAVRVVFDTRFPSLALFCFARESDAYEALAGMRGAADASAAGPAYPIQRDLEQLYAKLREEAAGRRLALLAAFQQDVASLWARDSVEKQVAQFDHDCLTHFLKLSDELHCPDLRIYLLDSAWAAERSIPAEEIMPGTPAPRFECVWQRGYAPGAAVPAYDRGPIGYARREKRPVALHNQGFAADYLVQVRTLYPGLETAQSIDADGAPLWQAESIRHGDGAAPAAGALLVHPIQVGERVIGAIVCNGRSRAPYVFHEWDEQSLALFSLVLGATWLSLHSRLWAERDRGLLDRAAKGIDSFTKAVRKGVSGGQLTEEEIYRAALDAADQIAGLPTQFSSIKRLDRHGNFFFFDERLRNGPAWEEGAVRVAAQHRYPAKRDGAAGSATVCAFQTGQPVIVDTERPPEPFSNIFPGRFRHAAYVPIRHGGNGHDVVAVLDIRSRESRPFAPSFAHVMRELGQVVGLLLALAEVQRRLKDQTEQQATAFEDLAHQILSPHRNLVEQLEQLIRRATGWHATVEEQRFHQPLLVARGHARRADRVGRAAALFAELSAKGHIERRSGWDRTLAADDLHRLMLRLVQDHRSILHAREGLRIDLALDETMLGGIYRDDIRGDVGLFEQAMSNLLDNAHKYSYRQTTITVGVVRTATDEFAVEVRNYGVPIRPEEVETIKERGVRGGAARLRSVSGHGIGLWLVERIMHYFGGRLEIISGAELIQPHLFRLVFPSSIGQAQVR